MRQKFKLASILISAAFLSACGFDLGHHFDFLQNTAANVSEAVSDVSPGFMPLEPPEAEDELKLVSKRVFVRHDDFTLGMYETIDSIYLGAFIEDDSLLAGDIGMFERLSGVNHAIFAYRYTLGESFPIRFILQSLARGKTPLIEIHPGEIWHIDYEIDYYQIEELARAFGQFDVPMFISFNASEAGLDMQMSKDFFIALRKAFAYNVPKAAFVWSVSFESGSRSFDYYPGDEWVDWVGITAFSNITEDGGHSDIFERLDNFYFNFHTRKPIMITSLGISNFSTVDHSYRIAEASAVIEYIYERIAVNYPRVKAIIYAGCRRETGGISQSHQLTDSDRLLISYQVATSGDRFASEIKTELSGQKSSQWIKSRHDAKVIGDTVFISRQSLMDDFGASSLELDRRRDHIEIIDGEPFFNAIILPGSVIVDEKNAVILVSID